METNVMHYRKIWEQHHDKKIPSGCEIHHKDGNRKNNDTNNLLCVTIEEHLQIHRQQEDWGAVQAILLRMDSNTDITINESAALAQKERWEKGTHNFQKMPKERRIEISKKVIQDRLDAGNGAFLIEDTVENARRAGRAAAEKKAGFLNTDSENHGSKHVKNTCWWTNSNGERKRAHTCPGKNWKKGMKYES